MKKLREMLKNEKGFTLIELLAVIVILGIIAAIAIPSIGSIIGNTKSDAHNSNALSLLDSARLAQVSGEATTAQGEGDDAVNVFQASDLVKNGYLDAEPINPETDTKYSSAYVTVDGSGDNVTYKVTLGDTDIKDSTKAQIIGSE